MCLKTSSAAVASLRELWWFRGMESSRHTFFKLQEGMVGKKASLSFKEQAKESEGVGTS